MFNSYFYTVRASSQNPDHGQIQALDFTPAEIKFSAPPEFGGMLGTWTPEHFLLSAVASCFVATFEAIAKASKFSFSSLTVVAEGIVGKRDARWNFTSITLNPTLAIESEEDRDRAVKLLEKTEHSCIVANSLSIPIAFAPQIKASINSEPSVDAAAR